MRWRDQVYIYVNNVVFALWLLQPRPSCVPISPPQKHLNMQKTGYSCVQCMRQPNCSCRKTPVTSRYKLARSESGDLYSHDLACGRSVQHVALAREGLLPTEGCNCAVQLYMIQRYQRQLCKAFFTSRLDSPGQSCMSLFLCSTSNIQPLS